MDVGRFDALTKLLASSGTRRRAAGGLLGGMLNRFLRAEPSEASDSRNKKARSKQAKRTKGQQNPPRTPQAQPGKKSNDHHNSHRNKRKARNRRPHAKETKGTRRTDQSTSQVLAATAGLPEIDYFALGDSIASGYGLQDSGDCRQSVKSYPSKVKALLSEQYHVNFHHLACSGATASESLPKQMDEALRILEQRDATPANRARQTLVSITIGANDLEWADLLKLSERLIFKTDAQYVAFVDKRVEVVAKILTLVIRNLLAVDGVRVVLTDVHDPFNKEPGPLFVRLARQFWPRDPRILPFGTALRCSVLECIPGLPCGAMDCADRADLAVTRLGNALSGVQFRLSEAEQARVQFAHPAFAAGQNEAPRNSCGAAPPSNEQTWIQYPGDPNSNSIPGWDIKVGKLTQKVGWIGGDCFHPNEKGATAYAEAVYADAVRLGFDGRPCFGEDTHVCCLADRCEPVPVDPTEEIGSEYRCSVDGIDRCTDSTRLCTGPACSNDDDCDRFSYCLSAACCGGESRCSPQCPD